MNNGDKITFDELIESGKTLPNEEKLDGKIFKDEPRKRDYTIPILCVIAALFIAFCAYYTANAYTEISGKLKVSGTTLGEQLNSEESQYKDGKVNINAADSKALCALKDIGETRALAIITHREVNGPFKSIEDIKNVKGIGEKIFDSIKNDICV